MTDRIDSQDNLDAAVIAELTAEMAVIEPQIATISKDVTDRMKANGWGSRADGPKPQNAIKSLDTGLKGTFSDNDWETVGSHE